MIHAMCTVTYLALLRAIDSAAGGVARIVARRDERGQASAEYALVLLGAALLAIFLGQWAMKEDTIKTVFKRIIDTVLQGMP